MEDAAIALDRIRNDRAARSMIFYGLRGVGKTVLLTTIRNHAEGDGLVVIAMEPPANRSLPCMLVPAIRVPLEQEDVSITSGALDAIFVQSQGYPYFLQEWGKHSWDLADAPPNAGIAALAELDSSFFRVRLDRLSPAEKRYMRAMTELGEAPHRSGDIAEALGMRVQAAAPTRNSRIRKGMLYSPAHGDTAFTVTVVRRIHAPCYAIGGLRDKNATAAEYEYTVPAYALATLVYVPNVTKPDVPKTLMWPHPSRL